MSIYIYISSICIFTYISPDHARETGMHLAAQELERQAQRRQALDADPRFVRLGELWPGEAGDLYGVVQVGCA